METVIGSATDPTQPISDTNPWMPLAKDNPANPVMQGFVRQALARIGYRGQTICFDGNPMPQGYGLSTIAWEGIFMGGDGNSYFQYGTHT